MPDPDLTSWHIPVGSLISQLDVVTVTRPALLFLLGHCVCVPLYPRSLLSSLPALLTFAPQALQAPLPRRTGTPGGVGSDMRDIIATTIRKTWHWFASLQLKSQSEIRVCRHEPGRAAGRRSSLDTSLDHSRAVTDAFQGHRFRSAFLGLSCTQTTSSRRQRKLRGVATEQPQRFILNFFFLDFSQLVPPAMMLLSVINLDT